MNNCDYSQSLRGWAVAQNTLYKYDYSPSAENALLILERMAHIHEPLSAVIDVLDEDLHRIGVLLDEE